MYISTLFAITAVPPANGDGSSGNPYQIANIDNLYWISQTSSSWDKYFIQTADIDASGTIALDGGAGWNPIGPTWWYSDFKGYYDGQDYNIDGLFINRPSTDYVGLFGDVWNDPSILQNIHLSHVNITGKDNVGSIAGCLYGNLSNCSAEGTVNGERYVGGLIGTTCNGTPVSCCYNNATITSSGKNVGGICGQAESIPLENCYNTGKISGVSNVGGIAGYNMMIITNSYSTASISGSICGGLVGYQEEMMTTVDNCIWNSDTISTGIASGSNSGTSYGKTTAEMKIQTTYMALGWDFTSIWSVDENINNGYSYLQTNLPEEALPIILSEFKAEQENGNVLISWKTESETNNARFLIYRDGEVIGTIEGAGTSSESHHYSFTDSEVISGNSYTYVLADLSYANEEVIHEDFAVTVNISENNIPLEFILEANYPNPFNPITTINYALPKNGPVTLNVYDITGNKIRILVDQEQSAGYRSVVWDGRNNEGIEVNSGMYIFRITTGDYSDSRKMLMIK